MTARKRPPNESVDDRKAPPAPSASELARRIYDEKKAEVERGEATVEELERYRFMGGVVAGGEALVDFLGQLKAMQAAAVPQRTSESASAPNVGVTTSSMGSAAEVSAPSAAASPRGPSVEAASAVGAANRKRRGRPRGPSVRDAEASEERRRQRGAEWQAKEPEAREKEMERAVSRMEKKLRTAGKNAGSAVAKVAWEFGFSAEKLKELQPSLIDRTRRKHRRISPAGIS